MSEHFKKFFQQQKETYIETAKKKLEAGLLPVFTQLVQIIVKDDFDERSGVLKALLKIVHRRYDDLLDELKAEGREAEALAETEVWIKNLTATAYDDLKRRYPNAFK